MTSPLQTRDMPATYQTQDAAYTLRTLHKGESVSLVGIGSVGKSNLLRHIIRLDVRQEHLKSEQKGAAENMIMVLLDPHNLIHLQGETRERYGLAWAGYELMLARLDRTLDQSLTLDEKEKPEVTEYLSQFNTWRMRLLSDNLAMAQSGLRWLEVAVYRCLEVLPNKQIVFIFDEIDDFQYLSPEFFQSLRGLRDDFKGRVMYVCASREELEILMFKDYLEPEMRRSYERIDGFVELFRSHTKYISPLDEQSIIAMSKGLVERYKHQKILSRMNIEDFAKDLGVVTGGHAGLVRKSYNAAIERINTRNSQPLGRYLITKEPVIKEMRSLIHSLSPEEREVLRRNVGKAKSQPHPELDPVVQKLIDKHLICQNTDDNSLEFVYPIVELWLEANPGELKEKD